MAESTSQTGHPGQQQPSTTSSEYNKLTFLVKQITAFMRTCTLVKVKAVTNSGDVSEVGFVDVQPIVNMVDSAGNSQEHGTVYHLPYYRLQGGTNAIIIDPAVDDIGIAVIADRDISSAKANKDVANPGSNRRFDLADGIYLGGVLNATPDQYLQFNDDGITITDKNGNSITMDSDGITITDLSGNAITMSSSGIDITGNLTNNGVNIGDTHTHSGVTSGSSDTGPPT